MIEHISTATRQLILAKTDEELYHASVAGFDSLLDADRSTVVPADDLTGRNQYWAPIESLETPNQMPLIGGIVAQAYETGESWVVDDLMDTRSTETRSASSDLRPYRSLLCVPVDGWGVLVAVAKEVAAFSDVDLEAVERFRSYVTAANTRISTTETRRSDAGMQEVASILSHDVRNPLAVANGNLELAREERDSEHLARVATAHERLEELIDDLVGLAHTGEHLERLEAVELEAVAERAWSMVESGEADLVVVDTTTVLADRSQLCQLFENLFGNAVEHGGPSVTVRVGLLDESTGFFVEDTGPGIPSEEREKVFDRGHSSDANGTGLGLFIVENVAEAHGWEITATESADGGARFELTGVETP